jgi:chromosome segregation ATPase
MKELIKKYTDKKLKLNYLYHEALGSGNHTEKKYMHKQYNICSDFLDELLKAERNGDKALISQLSSLGQLNRSLQEDIKYLEDNVEELKDEIEELQDKNDDLDNELSSYENESFNGRELLDELEDDLGQCEDELADKVIEISNLENENENLHFINDEISHINSNQKLSLTKAYKIIEELEKVIQRRVTCVNCNDGEKLIKGSTCNVCGARKI